jgi:hypothetical protein
MFFERKVYRRILGPVYDNEKESWRILTNKEIHGFFFLKKTYHNRENSQSQWLHGLRQRFSNFFPSGDHFYLSECSPDHPPLVRFERKLFEILNDSV